MLIYARPIRGTQKHPNGAKKKVEHTQNNLWNAQIEVENTQAKYFQPKENAEQRQDIHTEFDMFSEQQQCVYQCIPSLIIGFLLSLASCTPPNTIETSNKQILQKMLTQSPTSVARLKACTRTSNIYAFSRGLTDSKVPTKIH